MLFDLKGRRRRVVQGTYLMLAVLMGGGLVFFGIGGDVSGGLFDAFSGNSGSGNDIVDKRIERNEKKLDSNPRDKAALQALVRDWYSIANDEADPNTGEYTGKGKERLAKADDAWQRYLVVATKKPDGSLALLMMQVYDPLALNKPAEAAQAAEIVAAAKPSANIYLQLVRYAALAGQKRKSDLAGLKAIELAPKKDRSSVKLLVEQYKQPQQPAIPTG